MNKLKTYLFRDLWTCRTAAMPRAKALATNALRVAVLSVKRFSKDMCQLRASALTFFTLLSVVPVAALLFGIAKGYGFEFMLQQKLRASLIGHEEVADKIIAFSSSMLDSAKGGTIAGVGVLALLWTVIRLLSNIESSLNAIWGVKKDRAILRKISDYLSMVLICPFLIIVSGSATVFVASQATGLSSALPFSDTINAFIGAGLKILPLAAAWAVFAFLYAFMPNTKVKARSALIAGVVAGTLYLATQEAYVYTQIGVARYNAIYGSFAALPLFLIWLQLSWMIALFGAEVSYATQNVGAFELEPDLDVKNGSHARRKLEALELVRQVALDFESGRPAPSAKELAEELEMSIGSASEVLASLVEAGVLAESVKPDGLSKVYLPAMPTERLTPVAVVAALEELGENKPRKDGKMAELADAMRRTLESAPVNKPLSKI